MAFKGDIMFRRNLFAEKIILLLIIAAIVMIQLPFRYTQYGVTLNIAENIEKKEGKRPIYISYDSEKSQGLLKVMVFSYLVEDDNGLKVYKRGCSIFVKHQFLPLYKKELFFIKDMEYNGALPIFTFTVRDMKQVNIVEITNQKINILFVENIVLNEIFKCVCFIVLLILAIICIVYGRKLKPLEEAVSYDLDVKIERGTIPEK